MPGFLVHVGAQGICPHGGMLAFTTSNARVLISGQPALTLGDPPFTIAGCVFTVPGPTPMPCVTGRWLVPATRILINGRPAILQTSTGICQAATQAPQGPPTVTVVQTRVGGM